jgi:hypothetical protein
MQVSSSPSNKFAGVKNNSKSEVDLTPHGNKGIITGVKVVWSNYIVGLELIFAGQSSGLVKGSHSQNIWEENFNLTQGDYIVQVYGRHHSVISCLGFRTAKGLTKTWGNPLEGEPFTFGFEQHYIKALKLGVAEYLTYIEPVVEHEMFVNAQRLDFVASEKYTPTLGKQKNNSEGFDDYEWIDGKFNYAIAEAKIWHDGTSVYGIQFSYHLDGTKKTPGKHCAEANGLRVETLVLNEDEHIVKILVRAGEWIDHITLVTDQGRQLSAGGNGGVAYLASVPEYHQFVAIGGSTGQHLDTLQLYYAEYH